MCTRIMKVHLITRVVSAFTTMNAPMRDTMDIGIQCKNECTKMHLNLSVRMRAECHVSALGVHWCAFPRVHYTRKQRSACALTSLPVHSIAASVLSWSKHNSPFTINLSALARRMRVHLDPFAHSAITCSLCTLVRPPHTLILVHTSNLSALQG